MKFIPHKFGTACGVVRVAHRTLERGFSSQPLILIKKALQSEELLMADRVGFEPTLGFRPKHTFQACAFNHSATYPYCSPPEVCGFGARRAPCKIKDFIPCGTVPSDISRVTPFGRYHSPTTRPPIHIYQPSEFCGFGARRAP